MDHHNFDVATNRRAVLRGGLALGLGGFAAAYWPQEALATSSAVKARWPGIFSEINRYVQSGKVANMVAILGFGQGGADIISAGTLAMRSGAKVNADSLYRIYSMTKPITGMAAMMLVDEGKIGLDQNIADFIPGFANMMVQKTYDGAITADNLEPAKRAVTVRMLMTHTSGLGYTIIQKGPIFSAYVERGLLPGQVSRLPLPGFTAGDTVKSLKAYADGMAQLPLVYQPGTRWSYSAGLDILGRVIEVASGQSFEAFLQQRIFDPCEMSSTFFQVPEAQAHRLTTNYFTFNDVPFPADPGHSSIFLDKPPFAMGGAGLVSSPRDYDRFLRMLAGKGMFNGTRVMSENAVRMGASNLLPEGASTAGTWVAGGGFGAGGRVSGDNFGWAGAAGTNGFVNLRTGLRAGNFTQYMPSNIYPIGNEFPALVAKDLSLRAKK